MGIDEGEPASENNLICPVRSGAPASSGALEVPRNELKKPIWLLGHSLPAKWVDELKEPLDPRFPTRHSIWTPIWDYMQERVWSCGGRGRIDRSKLFVSNVAEKQKHGENADINWKSEAFQHRLKNYRSSLNQHRPPVLITFGADAYRFAAAGLCAKGKPPRKLRAVELGERFCEAVGDWKTDGTNVFPLLHVWAALRWDQAGKAYCGDAGGNYFEFVGYKLADLFLTHAPRLPIWSE
jgi:hypothetical protein